MLTSSTSESLWTRHARKVARMVNLGWWFQISSTPLVVTGLLGACALLFIRRAAWSPVLWQLSVYATVAVGVIALACWLAARLRFEQPEQSLVRIEAAMKLRNGLSAAKAGVAPWPELPPRIDAGLSWRWQRVIVPPLAAICFLVAGLVIPVSVAKTTATGAEQPQAWQKIEADLQRLEQDKDVIDESYVEQERKKLEELKSLDQQDWFSQSTLEASDSLKQQHSSDLQKMDRELDRANKAMEKLQKNVDAMTPAQKQNLLNQFDQAVQNLQNGSLKPNPKLMEQLKGLDPSALGNLDPSQLQQLKDNMKKAAQAAKDCQNGDGQGDKSGQGQGQGDWNDELNDGSGNGQDGEGQGEGNGSGEGQGEGPDGPNGNGPGSGGVDRGPGHAPGMLGKEHDKTQTGDLTGIDSKDLSRALPGDLLELQNGEHDVDKTARGPQAGGATGATGTGGDRVWKESLDPSEQKALKKFFE